MEDVASKITAYIWGFFLKIYMYLWEVLKEIIIAENYLSLRASSNSVLRIDSLASAAVWMLVTNADKSLCKSVIL